MEQRRILIVCGTGVATSTVVAQKVEALCREEGVNVSVRQGKVADLLSGPVDADLIVATTQVPSNVTVPVIPGLPFLTGAGLDEARAALREALS